MTAASSFASSTVMFRRATERPRTGTPAELLIIGLGNPGDEFAGTRHNVGAQCVALLAARHGGKLKMGKERALSTEVRVPGPTPGDRVLLALAFPQTYMNDSGLAAQLLVRRHGVTDLARVIVVYDELDLASGRVKLKFGGGTAGHNGLKSILAHLHSADFGRIRIGIGKPPGRRAGADFVLKRPGKAERASLDVAVEVAADAVESIVRDGFERTMNRLNTDP